MLSRHSYRPQGNRAHPAERRRSWQTATGRHVQSRQSRRERHRHRHHRQCHFPGATEGGGRRQELIVSHEPSFYSHEDQTKGLIDNPVFLAKQNFMRNTTW